MSELPDLSIIIPAYNEAGRIGKTLDQLSSYLKHHDLGEVEVIVAVATSRDKTLELAQSKAPRFEHFQAVDAGSHGGKGRDVKLAMLQAHGKYRLFMDADLATPLHHLETLSRHMAKNLDVI